jgi:hypothetical protein
MADADVTVDARAARGIAEDHVRIDDRIRPQPDGRRT